MLRTFAQHRIRTVASLDGWWDFTLGDAKRPPRRYDRQLHCPATWESTPGLENYRGVAWYRNAVSLDGQANLRLLFGGVSHTADVYLGDAHVGHHYDAFTPFEVLLPATKAGDHTLSLRVDNTFGDHSALHKENDYYTYGGITRPVELQIVPDLYLAAIYASPSRRGKSWDLELSVEVANLSDQAATRRVVVEVADQIVDLGEANVPAGEVVAYQATVTRLAVNPWTMQSPALYEVQAVLLDGDEPVDDLIDRVGFREVAVRGKKLLLNGEPIRLRGFNRHEDYAQLGCAVPKDVMVRDLLQMQDLGCNFVRTCHYPNDMRFLDLCDEMGFAVWEESHARNIPFDTPMFDEQMETNTREMVLWHWNHPSILMWGCLNECDSVTKAGAKVHERVLKQLKDLDPHRPVTFASNKDVRDLALKHVDIVSWNRYDNWYGSRDPAEALKEVLKWLDSPRSGGKGKPVIMSEFGAGAIPGWRAPHRDRWTEEYQCDALDTLLECYLHHPRICGAAIWQFCDVRLTKAWWQTRPRNMNNKGVVDEYRRPKLAYATVKRKMHEAIAKWDK